MIRDTIEKWLFNFLKEFMEKRKVTSAAKVFTAGPGLIAADKVNWASFVLDNTGDEDVLLYNGVKTLAAGDSMEFGPYFNSSMRADRVPFEFVGGGVNPRLEVWYDQYLPNQ